MNQILYVMLSNSICSKKIILNRNENFMHHPKGMLLKEEILTTQWDMNQIVV